MRIWRRKGRDGGWDDGNLAWVGALGGRGGGLVSVGEVFYACEGGGGGHIKWGEGDVCVTGGL